MTVLWKILILIENNTIYWLITCLPTREVRHHSIKFHDHISQYMSAVQKDIGNNIRGSKYQLLIDKTVALDLKSQQTNVYLDCLWYLTRICEWPSLYKHQSQRTSRRSLKISMGLWKKTQIYIYIDKNKYKSTDQLTNTIQINLKQLPQITIKCGLYQGDVLSPLLFYIDLSSLI